MLHLLLPLALRSLAASERRGVGASGALGYRLSICRISAQGSKHSCTTLCGFCSILINFHCSFYLLAHGFGGTGLRWSVSPWAFPFQSNHFSYIKNTEKTYRRKKIIIVGLFVIWPFNCVCAFAIKKGQTGRMLWCMRGQYVLVCMYSCMLCTF